MERILDWNKYLDTAAKMVSEGIVMLKNDNNALPIDTDKEVAVFGRIQFHYYKSGLGSGGLVNTRYVVGILDALKECKEIQLDEKLLGIYTNWIKENPYDEGQGWGRVPWSQKEMEVTEEMLDCARSNDVSLVIIGRTAGEDQDNNTNPGSYCLTETEEDMIRRVCEVSKRTVVVLNVGNIIDMSWVEKYHPQAVLYAWQGGQEGGNGVADVLTGKVCACGKLTDTIAERIEYYPSTENFGDPYKNYYKEDIYVGYRYFETFAKDKVLYPFGYGLSYTTFETRAEILKNTGDEITVSVTVSNTGEVRGKEVVQVYVKVPQGKLGNPARKLIGFAKTKELAPGEQEEVCIVIQKYDMASYDDSGVTGHKSCYVLEEGCYEVFVGSDVRSAVSVGCYEEEFRVIEELEEAYAPVEKFQRMKAVLLPDGTYQAVTEEVPVRTVDPQERRANEMPETLDYTGDKGYKLVDVLDKKVSMEEFVAQISEEDLIAMFRGEGMCSPKVTAGTAAAFGGVTDGLTALGIPVGCCSDGPSGIRMDCGTKAFSLPNGTSFGCTFNVELVGALYEMTGKELRLNKIDSLLGPGMNIHRNPLNGRNFEYFSEDPVISGTMASAITLGVQEEPGVGACLKHFSANNQETDRSGTDSIVSERALREIYLKGFEMVVKSAQPMAIMSYYNKVNGTYACENFDLLTSVPRGEWGFDGMVMTDWGAGNRAGVDTMMHAGNDLVMPGRTQDRMIAALQGNPVGTTADPNLDKTLVLGDIQKCVSRVLTMIMRSSQFGKMNSKVDVKAHTETYDNLVTYSSVKKEEVKTTAVKKLEDELKKAQEKADKLEKELGEANQKTQAANKEVEKLQAKLDVRTKNIRLKSAKSKKAKQATIRWAKVKNVDGYVVEYSTKANMKSAKKKTISETAGKISKLKKKKTYYVQVRMYQKDSATGKKKYGAWSKIKTVKIK